MNKRPRRKLTDAQQALLRYTEIRGRSGSYTVHLKIDHQSFQTIPHPVETLMQAKFFAAMLVIALERMLKHEAGE